MDTTEALRSESKNPIFKPFYSEKYGCEAYYCDPEETEAFAKFLRRRGYLAEQITESIVLIHDA
ncbi:hypothetical protein [Synechococcus sp. PCC 6312]|uniref:hypothetical protein n=1 Tax=Synechococcus sp. (strain ATCC 27167 / PCC 6312) TaxID=195253 RepID=UPI00029F357D|nr:hypothetical protein [Synechococcus sp. PCC 6312]AFY61953.1 hypothetical protein Syn6312_2889 [Synechococcus sp. PCC 6312]